MSGSIERRRVDTGPGELTTLINIQNLLLEARRIQSKILEEIREQEPEGITEPLGPVTVTESPRVIQPMARPWFTVSVINDGPNEIHILVNSKKSVRDHVVQPGEPYNVVMGRALIQDMVVWCDPGKRATIRVVGTS